MPRRLPEARDAAGAAAERAVVAAMLGFGEADVGRRQGRRPRYAKDPAANDLLFEDPFAFLVGVLFDQGIPAPRAWSAPHLLATRLGHLDPARIAADPAAVARAVATPPMLHRFKATVPRWVCAAARRVLEDYGGDAGAIWGDGPTARALQSRLVDFEGIGQKKSAMAVELLARDFGVRIEELGGSDVAYDVHVRRVFLRTGLAAADRLDDVVDAARRANPARPGSLDHPAWVIGRRWCGAGTPHCGECPLGAVCPRHLDRADGVRGN